MTETQPPATTTRPARGSVAAAQEALDRHRVGEAARRAAADAKQERLLRHLAAAEERARRAARAAEQLGYAGLMEQQADELAAAVAARMTVVNAADAELGRIERQRAELAAQDASDQDEVGHLLAAGDMAAAGDLAGHGAARVALTATLDTQAARARAQRAAAVEGAGRGDALADLERERDNALYAARNAREAAEVETVDQAQPVPAARPAPPMNVNVVPTIVWHRDRPDR